ncbi:hypothetical protein ROZALSC1DRAFT_27916 [Rozella allomycis CSF55]|uniref:Uncharacterized protein n=1 Tax=Rozella allomycis (strain CSF55) TaxID=988480 RepID=A0A075B0F1_ROZAC|nr:hypothetical protein O9G_000621 [Rozella allomycis CSF55]RKP20622.1 hypothetical protein ROZALSC1DRAFT_27916 [Rozella allomycis CSF55]|eukprot:EPZ34434.1 hypothetical protein O9G_000621 [Rozella allomycis CSF55]
MEPLQMMVSSCYDAVIIALKSYKNLNMFTFLVEKNVRIISHPIRIGIDEEFDFYFDFPHLAILTCNKITMLSVQREFFPSVFENLDIKCISVMPPSHPTLFKRKVEFNWTLLYDNIVGQYFNSQNYAKSENPTSKILSQREPKVYNGWKHLNGIICVNVENIQPFNESSFLFVDKTSNELVGFLNDQLNASKNLPNPSFDYISDQASSQDFIKELSDLWDVGLAVEPTNKQELKKRKPRKSIQNTMPIVRSSQEVSSQFSTQNSNHIFRWGSQRLESSQSTNKNSKPKRKRGF